VDDAPGTGRASIRWIGHSTVLIALDGVRLLTDPLLRVLVAHLRRRVPIHPDATRGIDAVLISHAHHDHLDLGSLQRLGRKTPLVVPRGLGSLLHRQGFRDVHELAVGEGIEIGAVRVEATFAAHDGSRPPYPARAPAVGYAVLGSRRVYFAGDTNLFPEMDGLVSDLDLALIPIWGWGPSLGRGEHLDPEGAAEAIALLHPATAVPIHWGTYAPLYLGLRAVPAYLAQPQAAFSAAAARLAPGVAVRITGRRAAAAAPSRPRTRPR
jgi:L-ascorbate metabolism protein UlaG (beta-lactamase superfamily)